MRVGIDNECNIHTDRLLDASQLNWRSVWLDDLAFQSNPCDFDMVPPSLRLMLRTPSWEVWLVHMFFFIFFPFFLGLLVEDLCTR